MAPFDKHCVEPTCEAYPCFGRKVGDVTEWACGKHKSRIGFGMGPRVEPEGIARPAKKPEAGPRDLFAAAGQ